MIPYYRMYCAPLSPEPGLVDCGDQVFHDLLREPPRTRRDGWTLWSAREVRRTIEGLEAIGIGERRITLLTNGHIEFWMPCLDTTFQWGQAESERQLHPWLYDYAVCELPVNFMMLARAVYDHARLQQDIHAGVGFYGIKGFILMPYGARTMEYYEPLERGVQPYPLDDLSTAPVKAASGFVPDHVAYEIATQVYNAFGFNSRYMRLFDEQHMFREA